ncbi:MAG: hypothetical protein BroJett038_12440 [Chloroflexota bacterium]|nr:MAG: hypothetical protein BroJett038_12440 [Chloroflexota bacterium]
MKNVERLERLAARHGLPARHVRVECAGKGRGFTLYAYDPTAESMFDKHPGAWFQVAYYPALHIALEYLPKHVARFLQERPAAGEAADNG